MRIENLIGKKNYKKQLKSDSFQYGLPISRNTQNLKFRNLLQETTDKKANLYKDYKIPLWDKNTYGYDKKFKQFNPNIRALTTINKETGNPEIDFYTPIKDISLAASRNTVGHELGHAKYHIDMKELNSKLEEAEKKNKNSLIARILKMRKYKLEDNYSKNKEAIADKNISKYLKQMGLSKKDRQAHYYLRKSEPPKNEGRYKGKLGNFKYLKDYIFGFSLLPESYHLYKPLSSEWKDIMREHFYNIYFSVTEYIASIEDFKKNREEARTGKTLNNVSPTDWTLRTHLEWRKYLYGEGKASKLHQDSIAHNNELDGLFSHNDYDKDFIFDFGNNFNYGFLFNRKINSKNLFQWNFELDNNNGYGGT